MIRIVLVALFVISSVDFVMAQDAKWEVGKGTTNIDEIKRDILALRDNEAKAIKNKDAPASATLWPMAGRAHRKWD